MTGNFIISAKIINKYIEKKLNMDYNQIAAG